MLVGCGGCRSATTACATSTRSCSPRTRPRCARRSSGTGAASTPTRPATCTRTRSSSTSAWRPRPRRLARRAGADLAFTDSTTMGLGLVYNGIQVRRRRVVTTEHDFYATHEALRLRFGERPARSASTTTRRGHRRLDREPAVARARRGAGLLALTWVHSSTGVRLPIREIAAALPASDTLVVVDGVHGLGAVDEPIDAGATSSSPAPTSGCAGRAAPASCGAASGTAAEPTIPTFTPAPASPAHRLHARRLPQLRAPLGARRRVRGTTRPGRPADRRAGHAAEGGPGRAPEGAAGHADGAGAVGRHRLLRGRRA